MKRSIFLFILLALIGVLTFIATSIQSVVTGGGYTGGDEPPCCFLDHSIKITGKDPSGAEVPLYDLKKGNYLGTVFLDENGQVKDETATLEDAKNYCCIPLTGANNCVGHATHDPVNGSVPELPDTAANRYYYALSDWGGFCFVDSVMSITDWIKWITFTITIAAILAAGIMFITAGGSTERVSTAKKMLLYSIIGVVIASLAHFVPSLILFFM